MQHSLVEMAKKMHHYKSYITTPIINDDPAANAFIKDIAKYPHAFLIACLMDPQGKNNKAWSLPYKMSLTLGYFDIKKLYRTSLKKFCDVLRKEELKAYSDKHAKIIYDAVHKIVETPFMNGDASKIWSDRPKSSEVVLRFLDFDGCGFNSANTAPILLWRFYGVDYSDYSSIDIAPEAHVVRIFQRMGLIPYVKDKETAHIYAVCKARELNPSFPGIIDAICWDVGKKFCRVKTPLCNKCPFCTFCENNPEMDAWAANAHSSTTARHLMHLL
ncbi:MAG: hypothetical protein FWG09_03070 [Synergistaceae bacterium]|nr:hypothetical protein [Synergistaceae bacterium]